VTLCPFLVSFGIPLHTFAGCLRQCPSVVDGDHLSIALDENGPDYLLTRSALGGDVEEVLRGVWLIMTKLMD
jgi:hypothetical protein